MQSPGLFSRYNTWGDIVVHSAILTSNLTYCIFWKWMYERHKGKGGSHIDEQAESQFGFSLHLHCVVIHCLRAGN